MDGGGSKLISSMALGHYTTGAVALVDGQKANIRIDVDGVLLTRTVGAILTAITRYDSQGDVSNGVIKAAVGELLQITAYNAAAGTRYLQIHDAAALPANGTVPDWVSPPIAADESIAHYFGEGGLPMGVGIVAAVSTTRTTLTLAGAEMWISARYR